MLNIICVNSGNYLGRGDDYVARLKSGVRRNFKHPHIFTEITSGDGEGWWAKINLFEPGLFEGRCLYFDLDTVITGSLEDLASYDGEFAGMRDFYHPDNVQTSIMAWDASKTDDIYTRWIEAGKPQFHPRGDAGWIEFMRPDADRLQDVFPNQIVSFKAHCARGVPEGTSVVCFHGLPRPHSLLDLMDNWRL